MDSVAFDLADRGHFQVERGTLGILWLPATSYAWGFRSPEALDGDYHTFTGVPVVLL